MFDYAFNRTLAVIDKILNDIQKMKRYTDLVIQLVMLIFCAYNIVINVDYTIYFIIYICLGVISLIYHIYYVILLIEKNYKTNKVFRHIVTTLKLTIRLVIIGLSIYEYNTKSLSDVAKIMIMVTCIMFVIQVLIEIISYLLDYYIKLFQTALTQDVDDLTVNRKAKVIEKIGGAFIKNDDSETVDDSDVEVLDKYEAKVQLLADKRAETIPEKIKARHELQKAKAQEAWNKVGNGIKDKWHHLFKKKNK